MVAVTSTPSIRHHSMPYCIGSYRVSGYQLCAAINLSELMLAIGCSPVHDLGRRHCKLEALSPHVFCNVLTEFQLGCHLQSLCLCRRRCNPNAADHFKAVICTHPSAGRAAAPHAPAPRSSRRCRLPATPAQNKNDVTMVMFTSPRVHTLGRRSFSSQVKLCCVVHPQRDAGGRLGFEPVADLAAGEVGALPPRQRRVVGREHHAAACQIR
jgi:hypothetical protein